MFNFDIRMDQFFVYSYCFMFDKMEKKFNRLNFYVNSGNE